MYEEEDSASRRLNPNHANTTNISSHTNQNMEASTKKKSKKDKKKKSKRSKSRNKKKSKSKKPKKHKKDPNLPDLHHKAPKIPQEKPQNEDFRPHATRDYDLDVLENKTLTLENTHANANNNNFDDILEDRE